MVEDESSIRNVIYVLLGALECESDVAYSGKQALAMLARESFDAVLLDLRSGSVSPTQFVSGIRQIQPRLMGRILFITGEVTDPEILEMVEQNCLPAVRHGRVIYELWDRLRLLFGQAESASS